MKKRIVQLIVTGVLAFQPLFMLAQPSPGFNSTGDPVEGEPINGGGSAPVGSGIVLLISMAAGYGLKKVCDAGNKSEA